MGQRKLPLWKVVMPFYIVGSINVTKTLLCLIKVVYQREYNRKIFVWTKGVRGLGRN